MPRKEMEISSIRYCDKPRMKPPQIANRDKFPGIRGKYCHLLEGNSRYFSFHEYSVIFYINLLITINWFFTSVLHRIIC